MADYKSKYKGRQIDDAIDNVSKLMAKNFPLTIEVSGGGTYEIGQKVTPSATFTATREGADVVSTSTISVSPTATVNKDEKSWTAADITETTTFTTTITQGGQSAKKTNTWTFLWKKYYGVSSNTTLTNAQIIALTGELSTTKATSANTFNCTGGKYPYFCCPKSWGEPQFWVGGLRNTDVTKKEITLTNASGGSNSYVLYRLTELQNGSLSIEFK